MSYPALTKEIASEIFESSAPYRDDDEKEACQVRTYRRLHLYTLLIDGLIAIMWFIDVFPWLCGLMVSRCLYYLALGLRAL